MKKGNVLFTQTKKKKEKKMDHEVAKDKKFVEDGKPSSLRIVTPWDRGLNLHLYSNCSISLCKHPSNGPFNCVDVRARTYYFS